MFQVPNSRLYIRVHDLEFKIWDLEFTICGFMFIFSN